MQEKIISVREKVLACILIFGVITLVCIGIRVNETKGLESILSLIFSFEAESDQHAAKEKAL
ncbi:hypothetical protein KY305_14390 [Bacillus sp. YC2]|uniref:hypothetical protein n=1 Tax=Bacillus sp. YC2 TaxID=2861287 RepID=UPI001CA6B873|nr:hypothetical protein [Bacillus sp. YC2]MBY8913928.1 hypothetical protein [Bacillus sp. YC2]